MHSNFTIIIIIVRSFFNGLRVRCFGKLLLAMLKAISYNANQVNVFSEMIIMFDRSRGRFGILLRGSGAHFIKKIDKRGQTI